MKVPIPTQVSIINADSRNYWIDNLRGVITLLVVAHHAGLAYTTFAYFDASRYISSTNPVVDSKRWLGVDIFVNFNDIFFMPLMFLISGLFVFGALKKKGTTRFLLDRIRRLGIPFLIGVTLIIPLAYIPSFHLAHHNFNLGAFIADYLGNEQWPVGPPWFIWLLLAFSCLSTLLQLNIYERIGVAATALATRPAYLLICWFLVVSLSLIPMSLWLGQYTWTGIGPFDFQLNRAFFYFIFFLSGTVMGTFDWEARLFTGSRLLKKSWLFWTAMSLLSFALTEWLTFKGLMVLSGIGLSSLFSNFLSELVFVTTCIFTCLALLNLFKSSINHTGLFWRSLSANAYGIYLIHYVFVSWLQFALLNADLTVLFKVITVFLISAPVSWWLVSQARKIKLVAAII